MRTIAVEEHFVTKQCNKAMKVAAGNQMFAPYMVAVNHKMLELGTGRLADMDVTA